MCVPAIAAPLLMASTAISAGGAIMGAIGQSQQASYAAQVAENNRRTTEQQANETANNTALEAQRRYRALAQTKGQQQAAMAANGVDINFGTAVDLSRDTAMIGAEDVGQIYRAGNEKLKGFDVQAQNYAAEAAAGRAKASGALVTGFLGAAGTALGGASQVAKLKSGFGGYTAGA